MRTQKGQPDVVLRNQEVPDFFSEVTKSRNQKKEKKNKSITLHAE